MDSGPLEHRVPALYIIFIDGAGGSVGEALDRGDVAVAEGVQTMMQFVQSLFGQYWLARMAEVVRPDALPKRRSDLS